MIAMIELADAVLGCSHLVMCVDRLIPSVDAKGLARSLQWVGFEPITLDHWAKDVDVVSDRWLFMGMEI